MSKIFQFIKVSGIRNLGFKFLTDTFMDILDILCNILNEVIHTNVFPDTWKTVTESILIP